MFPALLRRTSLSSAMETAKNVATTSPTTRRSSVVSHALSSTTRSMPRRTALAKNSSTSQSSRRCALEGWRSRSTPRDDRCLDGENTKLLARDLAGPRDISRVLFRRTRCGCATCTQSFSKSIAATTRVSRSDEGRRECARGDWRRNTCRDLGFQRGTRRTSGVVTRACRRKS